jgi:HEAT repeat protein
VVRASCSTAFAPTGTSDAWRNRVAALLLEKGIAKRDGALRVMSLWRDPTAFDLIRGRLADPDATIVAAALASLAPFGDVPTVREVSAFTTDERLAVRLEAVAALEQLPKDEVRNLVYEALKDRDPAIRVEAASQLARYPADPESYIRLHALLRDENPGVRASAAIAVADLANKRSFGPVLARLGEEKDELVLANLIDALGLADGPAAVPYLIDRIAESRGKEKSRIGAQLERITGEEIVLKPEAWKAWFEAKQHEAKQKGL